MSRKPLLTERPGVKAFRFLYNISYLLIGVLGAPYLCFKYLRKKKYWIHLPMRFGFYPKALRDQLAAHPFIWFHAVSVGEVISIVPLVSTLSREFPEHRFFLTTTTPTGYAVARRMFGTDMMIALFPLDFFFLFNPLFHRRKPSFAVFIETEIWPNSVHLLRQLDVPLFLVNGRISETSFTRYLKIRPWLQHLLSMYSRCFMQHEQDAAKIVSLGVDAGRVLVPGNLKFEACLQKNPSLPGPQQRQRLGIPQEARVIIAGSTHPGEEEALARIYLKLKNRFDGLVLVLAPRHTDRAPEIEAMLTDLGVECLKLSTLGGNGSAPKGGASVLLLDTIGDLFNVYAAGDIVFVGKSLTARGGQNIVEPAALGRAVLFGPNMENFSGAARLLLENKAAIQVQSEGELGDRIEELLSHPGEIKRLGELARRSFEPHAGTALAIAQSIRQYLANPHAPANPAGSIGSRAAASML